MRGDLSETSVADLCRGLSDAEATGAVELDGADGDARVYFRRGQVYWASSPAPRARLGDRLVNGGLLDQDQLDEALAAQTTDPDRSKLGEILVDRGLVSRDAIRVFVQEQILDALFDLMRWREGTYRFKPGEAADEKLPVDIPVDQLLVEVSRRQSEWDQIQAVIWDLDMVPDFVTGGSSAHAALEPDEFAVLASVDGQRSIRDLADDLGYSEFEAARIVYGLTLLGIVDLRAPDDDRSEAPGAGDDEPAAHLELDLDDLDDLGDLAVDATEPAVADRPRPTIRVHVADDLSDYVPARVVTGRDLQPPEAADAGDAAEEPQPWVQPDEAGPVGADTGTGEADEAPAEPESDAASAEPEIEAEAAPEPDEEPEVEASAPEPDEEPEVEAAAPEPDEEPGPGDADLDDADFDALISQLTEAPEPTTDDAGPVPAPEPTRQEPAAAEPAEPAEPAGPGGGGPAEGGGAGSDVSEFLRELSRLALDDGEDQAGGERPETPRRRAAAADDAAADAAAEARQRDRDREREREPRSEPDKRDGGDKKRGIFGWGR